MHRKPGGKKKGGLLICLIYNFSFNQHMQIETEHTYSGGQKITQNLLLEFADGVHLSVFFFVC